MGTRVSRGSAAGAGYGPAPHALRALRVPAGPALQALDQLAPAGPGQGGAAGRAVALPALRARRLDRMGRRDASCSKTLMYKASTSRRATGLALPGRDSRGESGPDNRGRATCRVRREPAWGAAVSWCSGPRGRFAGYGDRGAVKVRSTSAVRGGASLDTCSRKGLSYRLPGPDRHKMCANKRQVQLQDLDLPFGLRLFRGEVDKAPQTGIAAEYSDFTAVRRQLLDDLRSVAADVQRRPIVEPVGPQRSRPPGQHTLGEVACPPPGKHARVPLILTAARGATGACACRGMPASPHARPAAGCRGHHLDGVGVRLRLVEVYLRVERLLANALALRLAQRYALKEVLCGGIELLGGHYPVGQSPVERGSRVDYIARKGHFRCPFPADVPGDRHHRGMEEPATSAAGSGETGVLACHCEVGGCDQLAAGRGGEPMHTRHHRLGHLLDECHQFGAGDKQRTNRRQVGIGEIVPGAEHRADARKDYAQGVTLPDVAEGRDQLAHVLQRQGVAPLRPVHRDGGKFARPLDQDVLESHDGPPPHRSLRRRRALALALALALVGGCSAVPNLDPSCHHDW